jgi:hypothetical protein
LQANSNNTTFNVACIQQINNKLLILQHQVVTLITHTQLFVHLRRGAAHHSHTSPRTYQLTDRAFLFVLSWFVLQINFCKLCELLLRCSQLWVAQLSRRAFASVRALMAEQNASLGFAAFGFATTLTETRTETPCELLRPKPAG